MIAVLNTLSKTSLVYTATADFRNQEMLFVRDCISTQGLWNLNFENLDQRQVICKQCKISCRAEKVICITGILIMTTKHTFPRKNDNSRLRKDGIFDSQILPFKYMYFNYTEWAYGLYTFSYTCIEPIIIRKCCLFPNHE